ncbi:MAG TPA: RagB/SusD family nutrient uptake outer membrane protein [Longimicrobiales bacterium]|nr:RagB/SusD family nutrient uptake outer membrane protein [Longimicrobiales bacterium]
MNITHKMVRLAALAALVPFAACSDILSLDVEAPGRIEDDDLNIVGAMPGIAAGAQYNFTTALDAVVFQAALASKDIGYGGSYGFDNTAMGIFKFEDDDWGEYGTMSRARWTAEHGLMRMKEVLGATQYEKDASVARAYLSGGFANRLLGELQCRVNFDELVDGEYQAGPDRPHTDAFIRADSMFSRAIAVGTAAGSSAASIVNAAYAGRASVRAWMGRWDEAVVDAAKVPTTFMWNSTFSSTQTNYLWVETNSRREYSVFGSFWQSVTTDPRVKWVTTTQKGQDGQTPFYRQMKYATNADDIPIAHGAEMRVLQAEAALRKGDYATAETNLNLARAKWSMAPLTLSRTAADAWTTLRFERYATTWLEGRKLWDWRRWSVEGAPMKDPQSGTRDMCWPISQAEARANPNIKIGAGGQWGGCPTCG